MGDKMRQIPFDRLMNWALDEYKETGEIFGVRKFAKASKQKKLPLFNENGEKLEFPFGPAAGPHTQLAQNIIASYVAGGRFFELKTVQTLDGEDLPVSKPCISVPDEGYNVEWSTELYVPQALDEYIKGWFALGLLSRELGLGDKDGYVFNMSVGYDLEGIKSKKIDNFIEGLKDAGQTDAWRACKQWAISNVSKFKNVDIDYINSISSKICNSIALSTLHGCPPEEIERIATYLITEKKLNTFIKCNPTLLGYEYARSTLDSLGFDYMVFNDHHFKADLQFEDAVPMIRRLKALAETNGLAFGVKLTNTFPVKIAAGELPGEEMYMSGRSLFPLTIALAYRLSNEFDGRLRISFSGGADIHNIVQLFEAGIWPVTMATTLLKPGGYQRFVQMADSLAKCGYKPFNVIDLNKLQILLDEVPYSPLYRKPVKPLSSRKLEDKAPPLDCAVAPCQQNGCPINQDIPAYLRLAGEGRHLEALRVITERNPLPFITGTICPHNCTEKCTRNFYEGPISIREVKLETAKAAYDTLLKEVKKSSASGNPETKLSGGKVAIIGGGPAGLAAAYFLAKAKRHVTIFEKRDSLGGIVKHVIPEFRIGGDAIDRDVKLVLAMGAEVCLNTEIKSIADLRTKGFETVIIAIGAWKPGILTLNEGQTSNALEVLEAMKLSPSDVKLGKNVVIIGGGNTAMDTARAAKRADGVKNVYIVYRRTKRYMPADEEELQLAVKDGIKFCELLAPLSLKDGKLTCEKMKLGQPDASGRRSPVSTGETVHIPADTVISAIGDSVDDPFNFVPEAKLPDVYIIGDAKNGPATVAEAIADAIACTEAITGKSFDKYADLNVNPLVQPALDKKGYLAKLQPVSDKKDCLTKLQPVSDKNGYPAGLQPVSDIEPRQEAEKCLECATVCECCADVCPNRANVVVMADSRRQIIHMDALCNECGNCQMFCPYTGAPYKDKMTYFSYEEDFADSKNDGFLPLDGGVVRLRLDGKVVESSVDKAEKLVQAALACDRLNI